MPLIKTILCSGICTLYFAALTAQVPLQEEKTISNVIDQYVYQQKHCNIKQVLKDSVLFKYESDLHYSAYLTISHLSRIDISFTDCLIPPAPDSTVSEKLESHLQASLLCLHKYYSTKQSRARCRQLGFPQEYRRPIVHKFSLPINNLLPK